MWNIIAEKYTCFSLSNLVHTYKITHKLAFL